MARLTSASNQAFNAAQGTTRQAEPWIERFARIGYAAKGVVYLVIGALAAQAAFGAGGRTTGSRGALQTIVAQPFGKAMLAVIALGLFGYIAWRIVAAVTDAEGKGSDAKGIATRAAHAGRALVYAGLALSAVRLMRGEGGGDGGGDAAAEGWTARLMDMPFGRWLVGLVGAGIIAYGLYQLYRAYATDLRKHLNLSSLSAAATDWVVRFARFGVAARGVVFGVIGWFLIRAATEANAERASGLGEALASLEQRPHGAWLLGLVALGLIAYGLYELANARYRRIDI